MVFDPDILSKAAISFFDNHFNCSESMLLAFSKELKVESPIIPMIATPFGSGIGRLCQECGVLTGGIMVIGLIYGRKKAEETVKREESYTLSRAFYNQFNEKVGTVKCIEIQGSNLLDLEASRIRATERHKLCTHVLDVSVRLLVDLINKKEAQQLR